MSYGHNISAASAFELNDVRAFFRKVHTLRDRAFCAPELKGSQAVSVQAGVDMRPVRLQVGANDPTNFAMRIYALAEKFRAGPQNKIAFHALPHVMKLILARPHIRARSRDRIALLIRVVDNRTGRRDRSDVFVT